MLGKKKWSLIINLQSKPMTTRSRITNSRGTIVTKREGMITETSLKDSIGTIVEKGKETIVEKDNESKELRETIVEMATLEEGIETIIEGTTTEERVAIKKVGTSKRDPRRTSTSTLTQISGYTTRMINNSIKLSLRRRSLLMSLRFTFS